eukprot:28959_1
MASEQKNRDRSRSRDRGHDRAHHMIIREMKQLAICQPSLSGYAKDYTKLMETVSPKKNIRCNVTGKMIKKLNTCLDIVFKQRVNELCEELVADMNGKDADMNGKEENKDDEEESEEEDDSHNTAPKVQTHVILLFLWYLEHLFTVISSLCRIGQMHFDEARDEILEILTKNVRAFVIMAEYVKWMITPTTWRVLFTAPLVILLLLFVNKSKNKRLSLNDLSDEFSELCVQMIKVLCRSNSSRKEGALTSIMDRINFSLLAALHCGIWRPNGPSNQNEEMPWMAKPFEFNGYDDYAIKIVEALRGMASGTVDMNKNFFADEWNHVFATPRMLKLIELIKKYQDEGEFEEDAIVEAILNESRDGEDIEMIDKSEKSPNTNQKKSTKENKKKSNANAGAKQKRNTKPKNNKKSTNGTGAKKNNRREPRPAARRA